MNSAIQGTSRVGQLSSLSRFLFERALPALLFGLIAYSSIDTVNRSVASAAGWLIVARGAANSAFLLLIVVLFVIRSQLKGPRASPFEAVIAIAGTFYLMLLALSPVHDSAPAMMAIGTVLVITGLLWSITALAVLGRCFGLFPEARGLVTRGPYHIVRHPLYLGEIVSGIGLVLPVASVSTLPIWLLFVGLQVQRSLYEERALAAVFPEYASYRTKTRRLIPFVW